MNIEKDTEEQRCKCFDDPSLGRVECYPSCPKYKTLIGQLVEGEKMIRCSICHSMHPLGACPGLTSSPAALKVGEYDSVKDSGERREFSTGSVRDVRIGKGRYDLIPPVALRRLAQHYENGAIKYGDRNWEKGQPLSSYADSMLRHCQDYLGGCRSEDHLAAISWNAFAIIFTESMLRAGKLPPEFNDMPTSIEARPDYKPETPEMPF